MSLELTTKPPLRSYKIVREMTFEPPSERSDRRQKEKSRSAAATERGDHRRPSLAATRSRTRETPCREEGSVDQAVFPGGADHCTDAEGKDES